jgi:uncharacterized protein (DUF885 family)
MVPTRLLATAALAALAAACQMMPERGATDRMAAMEIDEVAAEDARLVAFLDGQWEARVALSPEYQTYLGRKTDYDQWDDRSPEAADRERALYERQLAMLTEMFDREALSDEGRLNYDLAVYSLEEDLRLDDFRMQRFPLSQFRGIHSNIPVFLANYHKIETVGDARDYIVRVSRTPVPLSQAAAQLETRIEAGYPLPEFSYPLIAESARGAIDGWPITGGDPLPIYKDFEKKIADLDLDDAERQALLAELEAALTGPYREGYERFVAAVDRMAGAEIVAGNYGVGIRDNGAPFYDALLSSYTTTDLTADEIHELGLSEVARIQDEMRGIMEQVGFDGSLQEFFAFMRDDPQFYYPNTDEGREAYLEQARAYTDGMRERLDELFITMPKAPVEVRRVEPFHERAAGKAFYNQPAPDGSRPGIFYANLADMADMPKYQLEALVYHEAIPGHHMQRSIQIEMEGLPKFRQFGGYTAFTEGWGLYSELLPKEIGFYEDPYSDFGRLAMELWRAARLVVDTGLHAKGWEMQEAIAYLQENTPNPKGDTVKAIERYIVYPGQATAYKIGMMKILELREDARDALGPQFDIAAFHDLILTGGPVPLSVLEGRVDAWIAERQAS